MSLTDMAEVIGRAAGVIASANFPTGERASLRRMTPGHSPPLAFYRFAIRYLPDSWEQNVAEWMTLIAGMALMAPAVHRPGHPFGRALSQEGFSEARLERLLAADPTVRRMLFLRAVRFLASRNAPFDWVDAAHFLLVKDEKKYEAVCRRIARDYYSEMFAEEQRKSA